jgi:hypothetical protein
MNALEVRGLARVTAQHASGFRQMEAFRPFGSLGPFARAYAATAPRHEESGEKEKEIGVTMVAESRAACACRPR